MNKEIRLNAFDMNCVGHIQHGMWTHPRDRSTETTRSDIGRIWRGSRNAASSMEFSWPTSSPAKSLLRTRFLMGMGFETRCLEGSPLPGRALRLRSDRAVAVAGEVAEGGGFELPVRGHR